MPGVSWRRPGWCTWHPGGQRANQRCGCLSQGGALTHSDLAPQNSATLRPMPQPRPCSRITEPRRGGGRYQLSDIAGLAALDAPCGQCKRDGGEREVDARPDLARHHHHDARAGNAQKPAGWHAALLRQPAGLGRAEKNPEAQAMPVDPAARLPMPTAATETHLWPCLFHRRKPEQPGLDKYARANYMRLARCRSEHWGGGVLASLDASPTFNSWPRRAVLYLLAAAKTTENRRRKGPAM